MNKLLEIGQLMSNVLFNWKQQDRFNREERKMMESLQVQWDAAEKQVKQPKRKTKAKKARS